MDIVMKNGFIYIWYDRKNKRYYVGCHWGNEDDGYICSSHWMKRVYFRRKEDFKRKIIERNIKSREELFLRELYWLSMIKIEEIKPYNLTPKYYNLNIRHNEHWLKYPDKIKTIGKKISLKKTGVSTGPCSEETKEKIRKATKGVKKTYTEESYQRLLNSQKGRLHTEEWKEENSQRLTKQWASGERKGHASTEESRRKQSEANKGKQFTIPTEESRAKQSKARKALWADPSFREKMAASRKSKKL
jgi:hypothetical protein